MDKISKICSCGVPVNIENIDTDQIYPGRYLAITDPKEIGSHCLSGIDESLAGKFPQGGIVVAGRKLLLGIYKLHGL